METPSYSYSGIQKAFLRHQHFFVFAAPVIFVAAVYLFAPTSAQAQATQGSYWLRYWWLFPFFVLGATTVNTVGISGSALFVPFFIFIFPILSHQLEPETLVKVGLISEAFGLSSSSIAFIRYGLVDRRVALALVGGSLPFVVGGALLSFVIPEVVFHSLLGVALLASAYLLSRTDLSHGHGDSSETSSATTDGGTASSLPNDPGMVGEAGVETDEDGTVTRVDCEGDVYTYDRSGYLRRFANYGIGGSFQGLAGFGIGELGIISMLGTRVPIRVAIGTNHIVVALTAILASAVHIFGGGLVGGHSMNIASTPWNMVVFTVPATVLGGQVAPYVSNALETQTIKKFVCGLFSVIAVALFLMASGGI